MGSWYDGSKVLLTGASSGIGRELARRLVREHGCRVLGVARNGEALRELEAELPGRFTGRRGDVSREDFWRELAGELAADGPDLLVSCAGVMPPVLPYEKLCADLEKNVFSVLDTDFRAELYAVKYMLPLLEQSGRPGILQIASAVTCAPLPGMSVYAAAKAASRQFTEALGQELKGRVYVLCVCPGFARTNLFRAMPEDCFTKTVASFCMTPEAMAAKILRAAARRRRLAFPGADGRFMRLCYNLFGTGALDAFSGLLRRSGIRLFAGAFASDVEKGEKLP